MKRSKHRFTLVVETYQARRDAELAVLLAFAKRMPDGCVFNLLKKRPKK